LKGSKMLTPMNNLIMLERIEKEKTTASGLIVSADPSEASKAKVLAKGPQADDTIDIGDELIVDYNKGYQVKYEGKTYHFLDPKFVIAKA